MSGKQYGTREKPKKLNIMVEKGVDMLKRVIISTPINEIFEIFWHTFGPAL